MGANSVTERLARLLFIVPYVADRDGVPVEELAEKLGVKPAKIEEDIGLLSMVGQPPLTPDHLIDLYVEDGIVYVELDQSLSRPLRLTPEEARSLILGIKLVGGHGGWSDEFAPIIEKLLLQLPEREQEAVRTLSGRILLSDDSPEDQEYGRLLRAAVSSHHEISVRYYSASRDAAKEYHLKPLAFLNHTGVSYLLAADIDAADHEKLFRLDRIEHAVVREEQFEPTGGIDLERFRRNQVYFGSGELSALVAFDPETSPWVRERFPPEECHTAPDGTLRVTVRTSSLPWLAKWVLSFGLSAEAIEPPELRTYLADFCSQASHVYGSDGKAASW